MLFNSAVFMREKNYQRRLKRGDNSGRHFTVDSGYLRCFVKLRLLSVRFSTSLIVQFILFSSGFISLALYSALVATAIFMKPVIIGIYSWGLSRGNLHRKEARSLKL